VQVGNVLFLPQSFHVGSVSIVSLSSRRLDQSIKNPTFDHGTNGYVFKGGNTPKIGISKEKMMRHQMLVVFPTCSYNPQEVPEQTKNNISNVLQNYHIKAEAVGMFSPCFHHIF